MVEASSLVVELVVEPAEPPSREMPNNACSGQGFALVVRGGFAGNGFGLQWSLARPPCR
jgi:hypothetical protein